MDVTAFVALLDQLDPPEGGLLDRLGAEVPDRVRRLRSAPSAPERARTLVYHFPGDEPRLRTWRLTGNHVACLIEGAGPAVRVLRTIRRLAPRHSWAYVDGTRGLAALVGERLGANPAAWRYVQRHLAAHPGLLPELVETAGHVPSDDRPVPPTPRQIAGEFRQLLMLLEPDALAALVPHLHRRTVVDLARFGAELPRETVAWVVAMATPKERLILAKARWSGPDLADALARLGDADVSTALYLNRHTSVAVRARIMATAETVPEAIAERVLGDESRGMRLPALWSGDPLLVRAALLRRSYTGSSVRHCLQTWQSEGYEGLAALYGRYPGESGERPAPFRVPRYRSLLLAVFARLWERQGLAEARRLLDELPVAQRDRVLLSAWFDAEDGLDRLRAEVAAKTSTRVLVQRMRRSYPTRVWPLLEVLDVDWPVLLRADRHTPLSQAAWAQLAAVPGCPPRPVPEGLADGTANPVAGAGHWPAGREIFVPREWSGSGYVVAEPARRSGTMPPEALFTAVAPAARALNTYGCVAELMAGDRGGLQYDRHLRVLVDRHLGASADARVVAMRLLPDFAGTTEELLATAGAAAIAGAHA